MKLAYEAYDRAGERRADAIEATDADEAMELLRRQGLFVTELAAAEDEAAEAHARPARRVPTGRRLKHVSLFARQLHVLVSTGTPLVESLGAIERQARDPSWKAALTHVRRRVEEGASLHEAFCDHPAYFDPIARSLVAVGEASGKLPAMLDRLATLTRKQLHVRGSILGSMMYPALLLVVAGAVLVLMLAFVLPRFAELFLTLDVPLPPTTAALMAVSDALVGYWWLVLGVLVVGGAGLAVWLRGEAGKLLIDTLVLRVPIFGRITQSFAMARILRLIGTLLDSYLPLLEVLQLVRASASNAHYRELLSRAEEAVTRGDAISTAFNDPALVSPSVYEAMRSGESSGQLAPLMLNIAEFMDEDNDVIVKSLTTLIEPLILIVLGVLVGFVALSMFMPLFDLTAMTGGGG